VKHLRTKGGRHEVDLIVERPETPRIHQPSAARAGRLRPGKVLHFHEADSSERV
jgi:hypothetical protein